MSIPMNRQMKNMAMSEFSKASDKLVSAGNGTSSMRTGNLFYKFPDVSAEIFKDGTKLLPSVTEIFEMELAYLEHHALTSDELMERGAFFKSVHGNLTRHFKLCSTHNNALTQDRSSRTRAYFEEGRFSTGYATHGLFPYRGKFHPQLVKALLNIVGVKKGDTILDPMCGSGTTNVEAALMGINSFAVDQSPFCRFMTKTKFEAMTIAPDLLRGLSNKTVELFTFFDVAEVGKQLGRIKDPDKLKVYNLALLAFLDALGYSKRVMKSSHKELFAKVLYRYEQTVSNFLSNPYFEARKLGITKVLGQSNAFSLELPDKSIDAIITSPPYSFAIDYVENDEAQLVYLGYNPETIKSKMIGLVGRTKKERLNNYFRDMGTVCSEMARVLKKGKFLIIILGSNTNQTGGIRLEERVIESCRSVRLNLVKSILKPIKGLGNTMKEEYILFFEKAS